MYNNQINIVDIKNLIFLCILDILAEGHLSNGENSNVNELVKVPTKFTLQVQPSRKRKRSSSSEMSSDDEEDEAENSAADSDETEMETNSVAKDDGKISKLQL